MAWCARLRLHDATRICMRAICAQVGMSLMCVVQLLSPEGVVGGAVIVLLRSVRRYKVSSFCLALPILLRTSSPRGSPSPLFLLMAPHRKSPILLRTRNSANGLLRRFLWAYSSEEAIFGKSFRSSGHVTNPRLRSSHGSAPSVKSHMLLLSYKAILSNENTPLYMEVYNTDEVHGNALPRLSWERKGVCITRWFVCQ